MVHCPVRHPRPGTELQAGILGPDGIPVPPADYELQVVGEEFTFRFKKPHRGLSGRYTLIFNNDGAETRKTIQVNFIGELRALPEAGGCYKWFAEVPGPPLAVTVSEVFATSCQLNWKPPLQDGGAALTCYVVERVELGGREQWTELGDGVAALSTTYRCEDLVAGTEYKLRVRAVNRVGAGEPAEPDKPVVARDPWSPPSPPRNLAVTELTADWVDLCWEPPETDGGAAVERYRLEYRERFSREWLPCSLTEGPECKVLRSAALISTVLYGTVGPGRGRYQARLHTGIQGDCSEPSRAGPAQPAQLPPHRAGPGRRPPPGGRAAAGPGGQGWGHAHLGCPVYRATGAAGRVVAGRLSRPGRQQVRKQSV